MRAALWRGVFARFEYLKALGVLRPRIHEWLSDPRNMTVKAAGRLLLAGFPPEARALDGIQVTLSGRMTLTNNGEKGLFFRLDQGG